MSRRGIFAELQRAAKIAARERAKAEREQERRYRAAVRESERLRKAEDRAQKELARADEATRKRLEKEAREAHVAAMEAQAEQWNMRLESLYADIDSLLAATLEHDDYVELESFRERASHPPFPRVDLEVPIPVPDPTSPPPEPQLRLPRPPKGLAKLLGTKKHARTVQDAQSAHQRAVATWKARVDEMRAERARIVEGHALREAERLSQLEKAREEYARHCSIREAEVQERNKKLDELIAGLSYGAVDAVHEYIGIVLSNSVYPKGFRVRHAFEFEPRTAELRLRVTIPVPDRVPTIKSYKYKKSSDEIVSAQLPQKIYKDRYANAVHQVALRSFHEVFEADRRGIIRTIALEVGVETASPATGLETFIPFVSAAADRDPYMEINLAGVVPSATLAHLGAALSKDPFGLVAADTKGIRRT